MRLRISDPADPEQPGITLSVGDGESIGDVADRAAQVLQRPELRGRASVEQSCIRWRRDLHVGVLRVGVESLLVP